MWFRLDQLVGILTKTTSPTVLTNLRNKLDIIMYMLQIMGCFKLHYLIFVFSLVPHFLWSYLYGVVAPIYVSLDL